MTLDPLRQALLELAERLEAHDIPLVVAGGYGLILRTELISASGIRTLGGPIEMTRSTEDLDCFLSAKIVVSASDMGRIRTVLDKLGYTPAVPNMQFKRGTSDAPTAPFIKVDLLAAPVPPAMESLVQIKDMRVRPRDFTGLHAYNTAEAFSIDEELQPVVLQNNGQTARVYLPNAFSYLLLKLFALRDRVGDANAQGKYHALDLFIIWATITEEEWTTAEMLRERHADRLRFLDTAAVFEALFGQRLALGTTALRDQARRQGLLIDDETIGRFCTDVQKLLVPDPPS